MSAGLPLVFTLGERAVAHAVDPATPAGELAGLLALYLGVDPPEPCGLVCRREDGERALDPLLAIGDQVESDAEIEVRPAARS